MWISPCRKAFIGSHVDDFVVAATEEQQRILREYLDQHLTITDLGPLSIYVGITIERDRENRLIKLHQGDYIDEILEHFQMLDCNGVGTPMLEIDRDRIVSLHSEVLDAEEKKQY